MDKTTFTPFTTAFAACLSFVLQREGGFVNNPNDPGGATNKGITQKVYDQYRLNKVLQKRSVELIEDNELTDIYFNEYWILGQCQNLSWPLCLFHFDFFVNGLPEDAFSILGTCENDPLRYLTIRLFLYNHKVQKYPYLQTFLIGWINRCEQLYQYC